MMLNSINVAGLIADKVDLEFDDKRKINKATFYIRNTLQIGKKEIENDFHVVVYGKTAEICSRTLSAGKKVTVSGRVNTWVGRDNRGNKRSGMSIIASDVYWD